MQEVKKEMSWQAATIIGLLLFVACSLHLCIQLLSEPCPHGAAFIICPNEHRVKLDNRTMVTVCHGKVFAICSTLNSTCKLHYDVESVAEINEDLQSCLRGACALTPRCMNLGFHNVQLCYNAKMQIDNVTFTNHTNFTLAAGAPIERLGAVMTLFSTLT